MPLKLRRAALDVSSKRRKASYVRRFLLYAEYVPTSVIATGDGESEET